MAVKVKERNGKWWLYVNWHGQRKKNCIGTKEAGEKARIMLEARLVLGAQTVFEPVKRPEPPATPLLFGGYFNRWLETYAKLRLAKRVGAIADDAGLADVDFTESLSEHRLHRIAKEILHHADLPSPHESFL